MIDLVQYFRKFSKIPTLFFLSAPTLSPVAAGAPAPAPAAAAFLLASLPADLALERTLEATEARRETLMAADRLLIMQLNV